MKSLQNFLAFYRGIGYDYKYGQEDGFFEKEGPFSYYLEELCKDIGSELE